MTKNVSAASLEIIKRMQQSELTESVIYAEIAKFAKGEENKLHAQKCPTKNENVA